MFCASLLSCLEGKTASKEKTKSMFMMKGIWREGNLFFHLILSSPFIPDKNADPKRCMPHVESPYFCSLSCIRIDKKEKNRMWITSPFKSILVKEQFLEVSDRRRKERVLSLLFSTCFFTSFIPFLFLALNFWLKVQKWGKENGTVLSSLYFSVPFDCTFTLGFHHKLPSQASITSFHHKASNSRLSSQSIYYILPSKPKVPPLPWGPILSSFSSLHVCIFSCKGFIHSIWFLM